MIPDYFFYINYKHFLKQKYRKSPLAKSIGGIFLVYVMNIVAILGIIKKLCNNFHHSIAITFILSALLYVSLFYWYNNERAQEIIEKYEGISKNRRIVLNGAFVIYLIISVILFFMYMPSLIYSIK